MLYLKRIINRVVSLEDIRLEKMIEKSGGMENIKKLSQTTDPHIEEAMKSLI